MVSSLAEIVVVMIYIAQGLKRQMIISEAVSKCSISKSTLICSRSRKAKILTGGIHGVFRGLKFEPVEAKRRSRSSGTQISDKRGRFEIGSSVCTIRRWGQGLLSDYNLTLAWVWVRTSVYRLA